MLKTLIMLERTIFTIRLSRVADRSAKPNEPMTEIRLLLGLHDLHESLLHLFRSFAVCKPQAIGNTDAMCICHNRRLAVDIPKNQIGDLSADPGERQKVLHRVGNLTVKFFYDDSGKILDVLCFYLIHTTGIHELFDLTDGRVRH